MADRFSDRIYRQPHSRSLGLMLPEQHFVDAMFGGVDQHAAADRQSEHANADQFVSWLRCFGSHSHAPDYMCVR